MKNSICDVSWQSPENLNQLLWLCNVTVWEKLSCRLCSRHLASLDHKIQPLSLVRNITRDDPPDGYDVCSLPTFGLKRWKSSARTRHDSTIIVGDALRVLKGIVGFESPNKRVNEGKFPAIIYTLIETAKLRRQYTSMAHMGSRTGCWPQNQQDWWTPAVEL